MAAGGGAECHFERQSALWGASPLFSYICLLEKKRLHLDTGSNAASSFGDVELVGPLSYFQQLEELSWFVLSALFSAALAKTRP
jgi:hypothetical protein